MAARRYSEHTGNYRFWGKLCICVGSAALLAGSPALSRPAPGLNGVVVPTALGGEILGYDIDPNGGVRLLAGNVSLGGGRNNFALETLARQTGALLQVV